MAVAPTRASKMSPPKHPSPPPHAQRIADTQDGLNGFDRGIVGDARVQFRLPLLNRKQVQRDLVALRDAADQALAVLSAKNMSDRSVLLAVRSLIKDANDVANARRRPDDDPSHT